MHETVDIAVVGGGLAGLAAAGYAARRGARTVVLEGASQPGGRARTLEQQGYRLNLGPHALYAGGAGRRVLDELGVPFSGRRATGQGGYALHGSAMHTLPVGLLSLLTTGLLSMSEKLALGSVLARLPSLDAAALRGTTVTRWIESTSDSLRVRELLQAVIRLSTYGHAPDRMDAGAALAQLQLALDRSVYYLDGGWQTLVDGLMAAAVDAGARLELDARVKAVVPERDHLLLRGARTLRAERVILAVSPKVVRELGADTGWELTPVRAACLDVALHELPRPHVRFALGIDRPLYYSVHTSYAKLAPERGAVVHAAKYLSPDEPSAAGADRAELEDLLERLQPGWRDEVVESRFSPRLVVSHALVTPAGRPEPATRMPGVFVAGDWVGDEGMLADAALASARRAIELALDDSTAERAA